MHLQNPSARKTSAQFALSAADQKRLQRLATAAESTPQRMLKFVLRDGFAYCEEFVRRVNAGLVSARRGEIISDSDARVELHAIIARHGRGSRKAA
jgi:predicted transcriptional regulator